MRIESCMPSFRVSTKYVEASSVLETAGASAQHQPANTDSGFNIVENMPRMGIRIIKQRNMFDQIVTDLS